jgi:hypothetical protein
MNETEAKKIITLSEDDFYSQYSVVPNHLCPECETFGGMYETYGKEVDYIRELASNPTTKGKVWTIVEYDGKFFIISGYHLVNRFGYLVTEEIVPDGQEVEVWVEENE